MGSLSRPYGGRLADRFGGARVTMAAFAVMALGALAVTWTIGMNNFWIFLGCFLLLFVAGGVGNGSTYRMIPSVFAARSGVTDAATNSGDVSTQRKTAASLGLISAIGAYGGFVIPQMLGLSKTSTGDYTSALNMFVVAYVVLMIVTGVVYLRRGSAFSGQRI